MENETRSMQVMRIVQSLATLPGGETVDVSCKRLPRLGPAEPGTAYRASTWTFNVQQVPSAVAVPGDTEEVIICLKGALRATLHKDLLVDELEALIEKIELQEAWDVRVNFRQNQDRPPLYELRVFPHLYSPPAAV